jgi:hypothetical protein
MSFIFSRALVEASLQANFMVVDAYAPSKLIPTPKRSSSPVKTTAPFHRSRFGMTFEHLTDADGEELLTLWLADFPAKTSVPLEQVTDSMESEADFGQKWRGSFAKFDHSELKWKTAQCSLLGDSEEFLETWPRWGSMLNGECFLRPIPALPICESASGLWQTPVADDAIERAAGKWNSRGEPKLSAEAKLWPTPVASDTGTRKVPYAQGGTALSLAVQMWPTPTASLGSKGGRITPRKGREGGTLIEAVSSRMWPTPCASASASKGSSPAALVRKTGKSRANDRIDHAVMATDGGQLNPEWVEWLMGWPIGHTALEPLATARYQEWQQQHRIYSNDRP